MWIGKFKHLPTVLKPIAAAVVRFLGLKVVVIDFFIVLVLAVLDEEDKIMLVMLLVGREENAHDAGKVLTKLKRGALFKAKRDIEAIIVKRF